LLGSYPTQRQIISIYINIYIYTHIFAYMYLYTAENAEKEDIRLLLADSDGIGQKMVKGEQGRSEQSGGSETVTLAVG
jgi:hypothetical protein